MFICIQSKQWLKILLSAEATQQKQQQSWETRGPARVAPGRLGNVRSEPTTALVTSHVFTS